MTTSQAGCEPSAEFTLSWEGLLTFIGCIEALNSEATRVEVMDALQVERDDLNAWSAKLLSVLDQPGDAYAVVVPPDYRDAIWLFYRACFDLLPESVVQTISNRTRKEMESSEHELLAALELAGLTPPPRG